MKLICLPGFDGSGEAFALFIEELTPSVNTQIIAYPPDRPLGYDALTDWVRERIPRDEQYALLAESFSGPLGIRMAADSPTGLRALILCATFASNPYPALSVLGPLSPWLPLRQSAFGLRESLLLGRWATPPLRAQLAQSLTALTDSVLAARLQAVLRIDVRDRLADIRVPTLLLTASHDRLIPVRCGEEIRSSIAGAQQRELQGPHWLLQAKATEAAAAIRHFLGSLDNG